MGIAFGLGVVFGIRAVAGSPLGVLPVVVLLLAAAVVTTATARNLCLIATFGCALGAGAEFRQSSEQPPFLTGAPAGAIVGSIRSDLQVTAAGVMTTVTWHDAGGVERQSRVLLPPSPNVRRGDRVELHGSIEGERGELIFADRVRLVERAGWLEQQRRTIREYLTQKVQRHVPGTPGALTLGLLIGDDSALTRAELEDLRRAGLSHLTAVSGWNVTLVTSTVGLLFLRFGLRGWGWTSLQLAALGGFVWIVGLDPPVTRAAIMAVAGLTAVRLGRPAHSLTVLTISAALMVAVSPDALTSLSFQLSGIATLGLIVAARITHGSEGWKAIVLTPVVATGTIGAITAPLLASEFGTLSLLTVPSNILAAPLVPAATVLGVIVVAASPFPAMAAVFGWGAWLLSALLLWLARVIAAVPYGFYEFAPLSDVAQAAMYAALLVGVMLTLPEGRLIGRKAAEWVRREPVGAALSGSAACVALLATALTV